MDEILGLGSGLPSTTDFSGNRAVKPEDLFRYSTDSGSARLAFSSSGTATSYFSINGGSTLIAGFNQNSNGDYGDWLSPSCPQSPNLPQYAFTCPGRFGDISAASPEGIALDVIGYDLATPEPTTLEMSLAGIVAAFLRRRRNSRLPGSRI